LSLASAPLAQLDDALEEASRASQHPVFVGSSDMEERRHSSQSEERRYSGGAGCGPRFPRSRASIMGHVGKLSQAASMPITMSQDRLRDMRQARGRKQSATRSFVRDWKKHRLDNASNVQKMEQRDARRIMLVPIVKSSQEELRQWVKHPRTPLWIFVLYRGSGIVANIITILELLPQFRLEKTEWMRIAYNHGGPNCIAIILPLAQLDRLGTGEINDEAIITYDKQSKQIIAGTLAALSNSTIVSTLILGALGFSLAEMVTSDINDNSVSGTALFRAHYVLTMVAVMTSLGGVVSTIATYQAINVHMPDDDARLRFLLNHRIIVSFASSISPYVQSWTFVFSMVMGAWVVSNETGIIATAATSILAAHTLIYQVMMQHHALNEQYLTAKELIQGIDSIKKGSDTGAETTGSCSRSNSRRLMPRIANWRISGRPWCIPATSSSAKGQGIAAGVWT